MYLIQAAWAREANIIFEHRGIRESAATSQTVTHSEFWGDSPGWMYQRGPRLYILPSSVSKSWATSYRLAQEGQRTKNSHRQCAVC